MGEGSKNNTTRGQPTLDPQIKQLPGSTRARLEESVDRLAGKVRDTQGGRRSKTNAPYGASSQSNRLEGLRATGFPVTPQFSWHTGQRV